MRKVSSLFGIVVLGVITTTGVHRLHMLSSAPTPAETAKSAGTAANQPASASEKRIAPLPPSAKRLPGTLPIPPELAGFETWTPGRRLNAITDLQHNPHLSPALCDFLMGLASDPTRRPALRNNAANALGIQDPPVPGWMGRLADQAVDPDETPTWRDYALQHLADRMIPRDQATATDADGGIDRQRYLSILTTVAICKTTAAGTALLHLDRLQREHGIAINSDRFRDLLLRAIQGEDVDPGARVTAFGILARRGDSSDSDVPRRFLQHGEPRLRRAAIAALGFLGTEADIVAINAVDNGGDALIDPAKRAACARLHMRRVPQKKSEG